MAFTFASRWGLFIQFSTLFVFAGLGIGLLADGILLKLNSDTIENTNVQSTLNQIDFNGNLKLGTAIFILSYTFLYKGSSCVFWAVFGGCAAYFKNRCAMVAMAMIVLFLFMQQLVFLGLWAALRDKASGDMKSDLKTTLQRYDGPISLLGESIGWDLLMIGYDCCGVEDVSSTNLEFENSTWWFNVSRGTKEIPFTCCKVATETNYKTGFDSSCTDGNYIAVNSKGCHRVFRDWLHAYINPAIILGSFLIVVEVMFIVFSFIICQSIAKSKVIV